MLLNRRVGEISKPVGLFSGNVPARKAWEWRTGPGNRTSLQTAKQAAGGFGVGDTIKMKYADDTAIVTKVDPQTGKMEARYTGQSRSVQCNPNAFVLVTKASA